MDKPTARWKDDPKGYARQWHQIWRKNNPEKAKADDRKKREKNKEQRSQYYKRWYHANKNNPGFKKSRLEYSVEYYHSNSKRRKQHLIRALSRKAIRDEKIKVPSSCQGCKCEEKLQIHHPDYDKPYEVEFYCVGCHRKLHKELRQKALEDENSL